MWVQTIKAYIESGEPMDKAGAYGIQGMGGSFVKKIDGCFFSVMGFPVHRFCKEVCVPRQVSSHACNIWVSHHLGPPPSARQQTRTVTACSEMAPADHMCGMRCLGLALRRLCD